MKKIAIYVIIIITSIIFLTACGSTGSNVKDFSEFRWPNSDLAKQLPTPKSNFGTIHIDSSTFFSIDVGKTTQSDFNDYVDSCMNKGFNVDYTRFDNDFFAASNEFGTSLSLYYKSDDEVMSIMINAAREDEPESTPTPEPESTPTPEPEQTHDSQPDSQPDGNTDIPILPNVEWKEFLRLYEEWIDSYIELLEKYNENPTDITILNDYLNMMIELAEWAEMAEEIEVDLANDPNALKEYLETLSRIILKCVC